MGLNLMLLEGESCDGIHTVNSDCSPKKEQNFYLCRITNIEMVPDYRENGVDFDDIKGRVLLMEYMQ